MTKEQITSYTLRISEANESQYVVILHEIAIDFINDGIEAWEHDALDRYLMLMKKVQRIHAEIRNQINPMEQTGQLLIREYDRLGSLLATSIVAKEVACARKVLDGYIQLKPGFDGLATIDSSAPICSCTQKVYEGLTYGPGAQGKTYVDQDENQREFLV